LSVRKPQFARVLKFILGFPSSEQSILNVPCRELGMSHYHSADFEEMEDEYDMNEPVDDMEGEDEYQELVIRDSDAEDEDDADQLVCAY
jgi:hypothetical protein